MKLFKCLRAPARVGMAVVALGCAAAAIPVQAQEQSMEERLRVQLRSVTSQLQQAQNELAQLKAGGTTAAVKSPAAPAAEVDALKAELAQSRQQLSRERDARGRRDADAQATQRQAEETSAKAQAQVQQFRSAYDELLKMARASEAERQRLSGEGAAQQAVITQCVAHNQQLYALGREVLQAYEQMDLGTVLAARQPFAAQSRVKFEQLAQQYGDRLYQGKFDVNAAPAQVAADAKP